MEMTHSALVQVFLSAEVSTREQSDDRISDAKLSERQNRNKKKLRISPAEMTAALNEGEV